MFSDNRLDFLRGSQISEQFLLRWAKDSMELSELLLRFLDLKLLLEKVPSTEDNKISIKTTIKLLFTLFQDLCPTSNGPK